ncbi:MAG: hypothetical protein COA44_06025 [Arcobacter sp.]|nr:MAG: hypothetical protein COA44_06025 [Arcobacter sp.]
MSILVKLSSLKTGDKFIFEEGAYTNRCTLLGKDDTWAQVIVEGHEYTEDDPFDYVRLSLEVEKI